MKIKYPTKRVEFEKLLKEIGYKNRLPLNYKVKEQKNLILEDCNTGPIKIKGFIKLYPNKKSYIWFCYQEMITKNIEIKEIKKTLSMIARQINFNHHSRIAEVGWEISMGHTIILWTKSERTKLYFRLIKKLKLILKNGDWGIDPNPGEILISRPRGLRYGEIHGNGYKISEERGHINQRIFNFGKVNSYGDQYAIYDENLNLQPISI